MCYRRGVTQAWPTTTWKPITQPLAADAGAILQAAISHDGGTLATRSQEGTVGMWDIETEQPVGAALPGLPARRSSCPAAPTSRPSEGPEGDDAEIAEHLVLGDAATKTQAHSQLTRATKPPHASSRARRAGRRRAHGRRPAAR